MVKLFEKFRIRSMEFSNRIVMSPMFIGVTPASTRARIYYEERAKGGVGAIITGGVLVDAFLFDDAWQKKDGVAIFLEKLRLLSEGVHRTGAKIGMQLAHNNRLPTGAGLLIGESVGPSDGPRKPDAFDKATHVRELTIKEIEFIVDKFARAAQEVKDVGMDFVEFHGAHSYMSCQFFLPATNHRNDIYGRDLTGRMRFALECVKAMRAQIGSDYPLFFRLGAQEGGPTGVTMDDSIKLAVELEKAGVDLIDVSTADPEPIAIPAYDRPEATWLNCATAIKRHVSVPVMTVGRINSAELAESILTEGKADLIAIGRQLIADPYWPQKIMQGRENEIVPCLSCNNCVDSGVKSTGLHCTVNPRAMQEETTILKKAPKAKKIFIAGGGPAGMQAAIVAAQRGHQVTLYEKEKQLGGQLVAAGNISSKERINKFKDYLVGQAKISAEIKLGKQATQESIARLKPDVVVVATGATFASDNSNVVNALDILNNRRQVGKNVVVIGGGMVGCDTAEFLSQKCQSVTIVESEEIGHGIGITTRDSVLLRLKNAGIKIENRAKVEAITKRGVKISQNGITKQISADSLVLATGLKSDNHLAQELEGKYLHYQIGDCVAPRKIADAMEEGLKVALQI